MFLLPALLRCKSASTSFLIDFLSNFSWGLLSWGRGVAMILRKASLSMLLGFWRRRAPAAYRCAGERYI